MINFNIILPYLHIILQFLYQLFDKFEYICRCIVITLVSFLPVKTIRDENGTPFLHRYHLWSWSNDGPGICFHHFVRSDPDRGYHDHPWKHGLSFIISGGYRERILNLSDRQSYTEYDRNRWRFNYLHGENSFHRVMIPDGGDAWTIFFFTGRSKTWGMIDLNGEYHSMSTQISDQDGGWWNSANVGYSLEHRMPLTKKVVPAVDIIVTRNIYPHREILLIERGKSPFKGFWAFPGGRIDGSDKDVKSAAARELLEETSIDSSYEYLNHLGMVGNDSRDPRGFSMSCIFHLNLNLLEEQPKIKAGDDAVNYKWVNLESLISGNTSERLAFDHLELLRKYYG